MQKIFRCSAMCAAVLTLGHAVAQTPSPSSSLREITVTGNPLGATDLITPAASLSGAALLLRRGTTLGETLDGTPGVSATWFGPNANRPVIRGLDGNRIRILGNGGASIDASGLSYDHAVPVEPVSIERIEVLRGPGALLYGGSAVGGVVNVIDNRIPREPTDGVAGRADLSMSSANKGRGSGFMLEAGNGRVGLHADVFDRSAADVRVPATLGCTQAGATALARRICNSASDVRGGAVGGSVFFDRGYLGASVSTYRNDYGAVAEDEVTIGMQSTRHAVQGEWRSPAQWLQHIKAQASHTDYRHTEFDAGAPGTVFSNKGNDFRLEARHARLGALDGVIGVQAEATRFSAVGDEAFAPFSRTRQSAVFVHEELGTGWGRLSFGARRESVTVESFGNPDLARFVPASRRFSPTSYALGVLWNMGPGWQLTSNLARTQRAPRDYELFADGPHVATAAYEVGNAALGVERSINADVGLQWKSGANSFKVNAFANRFANYIALESTGSTTDDLPGFAYRQVRARFAGLEASGTVRLLAGAQTLDLELRGDRVQASNQDTGQPLARIAPLRVGATLVWAQGAWGAQLGFDHSARQDRVPLGERVTDAYTLWKAALTWRMKAGPTHLLWYARLDNAGNKLAYSATSILTQTAPGKSPFAGRSVKLGVQATF